VKQKQPQAAPQPYMDLAHQIMETVETDCRDPNAFAMIIEGDSMEPEIRAGDRVIFAPNLEPRNGEPAVVKLVDGRVYVKTFHTTGPQGSQVRLTSINPNYVPMEFDKKDVLFVYPAWELKRRFRK
jgi:phage repressor protein C with HTH and peptisase S24 domain